MINPTPKQAKNYKQNREPRYIIKLMPTKDETQKFPRYYEVKINDAPSKERAKVRQNIIKIDKYQQRECDTIRKYKNIGKIHPDAANIIFRAEYVRLLCFVNWKRFKNKNEVALDFIRYLTYDIYQKIHLFGLKHGENEELELKYAVATILL